MRFPPGLARFDTTPVCTGSPIEATTIGTVLVGSLGRKSARRARCHQNVRIAGQRLSHEFWEPLEMSLSPVLIEDEILTFNPTQLAEAIAEHHNTPREGGSGAW